MSQDSELLIQIHSDLKLLTQKIESAFPKDDNDEIDYLGHRQYHQKQINDTRQYSENKAAIFRNVITWAIIGVLTVVASSIGQSHITPFIKSLFAPT